MISERAPVVTAWQMPAGRASLQDIRIGEIPCTACVPQVLRHPALAAELMGGVAVAAVNEIVSAGEGRGSDGCRRGERPLAAVDCSFRGSHKSSVGVFRASREVVERSIDSEYAAIMVILISIHSHVVCATRNLVLETL